MYPELWKSRNALSEALHSSGKVRIIFDLPKFGIIFGINLVKFLRGNFVKNYEIFPTGCFHIACEYC